MGRRHLTPKEIMEQCKHIARESRMAERTPWTAMGIICGYALYKSEGFKGQRISRITSAVAAYEEKWQAGEITMEEYSDRLKEKADWTIDYQEYRESDIYYKKGSYNYWLDKVQLAPQNTINRQSTRYMIWMFNALMDEYGYGKERLTRVEEYMLKLIDDYTFSRTTVDAWRKILRDDLGLVFEQPIDPITQNVEEF